MVAKFSSPFNVTNKDVWLKLIDLERKVDALSVKLYAFASAVGIIGAFLAITGGVQVG